MKQLLPIMVFGIFFLQSGKAQNYNFTVTTAPYSDLTGTTSINNGEIWDDPVYVFPVEFPFELNGHAVASFQFNGRGSRMASTTSVPNVITELLPFEAYLIDRGAIDGVSLSPISYTVEGIPGSQIEKIEFNNAGSEFEMELFGTLTMFVNFQCWLFEGSNTIEFHFGPSLVNNQLLFYGGLGGPLSGLADYNESDHTYMHGHFLFGPTGDPYQSGNPEYLVGEPPAGTVYRFTYLPPLSVTVAGVNGNSFCQPNGSTEAIATEGIMPYSYLWSTGDTTALIENLDAGTYYVTVEDDDGAVVTDSVTIMNASPMVINIASTDETAIAANDGTAEAFPSGGSSPYTYAWSNGATTSLITGLAPGEYSLTVTDNSACTTEQSITINAFICPNLNIEANIVNDSCFGDCNGSISVINIIQGTAPFSYLWSDSSTTPMIQNLCTGDYAVTVIDTKGCVVIGNYQVLQPLELLVNADSTNAISQNQNDGTAWATPSGGTLPYSYSWSNGSTDSLIMNLTTGIYVVTVTDANGCDASDSTIVNPFCNVTTLNTIDHLSCQDSCEWSITSLIESGGMGPFSYSWSIGDTTQTSIEHLCPGAYGLTIVDQANQCNYIQSFSIISPEAIDVEVDTVINLTDSTLASISISVLTTPPPYLILWQGPNGFSSFEEDLSGIAPGFYGVQIQNQVGGCIRIDSIEVLDLTAGLSPIAEKKLEIYPNPSNDMVFVRGIESHDFTIHLFTTDGVEVKYWKNTAALDVNDVLPGLYILKFSSEEISLSKSILIQQ